MSSICSMPTESTAFAFFAPNPRACEGLADPAPGATPAFFDPALAGKSAAAACAGCHGEAGVTATPGFPSLAALTPQYLTTAMKAYRSGQRQNDTMKPMLAAIGDAEINHIALFYALQKPTRAPTPAAGDPQTGRAAPSAVPDATAITASAAIPRPRVSPARMPSILWPRCAFIRVERAPTRR